MEVYKVRASYTRYRCSGRHDKSSPCHHKINLPSSLTQQARNPVVSPGLLEKYQPFHFYKMRYSEHTVAIALYFSVYLALPATTTAAILKDIFNVSPSPDTVEIWTKKAACCLYQELGHLELPVSGGKVNIDETFLFHNRRKVFWMALNPEHKLILAWFFSHSRDSLAAYNFLKQLKTNDNGANLTVVSDGLAAYQAVVPLLFPNARHLVYKGFDHLPNNNVIERQHGWFKEPLRLFWGLKSDSGIVAFAINRIFIYNFFIPQEVLGGKTPAEHAGLTIYRFPSAWHSLMHYVFKASYLAAA
jgi:transposase-like protein